jgi:hypothetical protein
MPAGVGTADIDIDLRLDFDHLGAHHGKPLRDLWAINDPAEIGYADAFERQTCHHLLQNSM